MSILKPHRTPEQRVLLAACTTSSAHTATPVRPEPGIAAQVLFDLRADDVRNADFAAANALLLVPMHDPAEDPQPIEALLARAEHVCRSRHLAFEAAFAEDRQASAGRRAAIAAATWVDEAAATVMTENAADIIAAVPAALAAGTGLTADVIGLALTELGEALDEPLPGSYWAANLQAVLPVRMAQPKGQVA